MLIQHLQTVKNVDIISVMSRFEAYCSSSLRLGSTWLRLANPAMSKEVERGWSTDFIIGLLAQLTALQAVLFVKYLPLKFSKKHQHKHSSKVEFSDLNNVRWGRADS